MQLTESLTKEGFSSLDSDYRINRQTDDSNSMKPPLNDGPAGDSSNKPKVGFTSPPPTSHPSSRSAQSKGNMRGNGF